MAELKDPAIKLFGKTILPLPASRDFSGNDEPSVAVSVVDSDAGTGESSSDRKLPLSSPNTATVLPDQNSGEEEEAHKVRVKSRLRETSLFSRENMYDYIAKFRQLY